MVDGGSYRSGYGESFWGSSKNLTGKLFRRRSWLWPAAAGWWPAAVAGMWEREMEE
nr:hypothetical protein [Tanacetum cinerariifolium]